MLDSTFAQKTNLFLDIEQKNVEKSEVTWKGLGTAASLTGWTMAATSLGCVWRCCQQTQVCPRSLISQICPATGLCPCHIWAGDEPSACTWDFRKV